MIAGKEATIAFLASGCPISGLMIFIGTPRADAGVLETPDGKFIATWYSKYDRPLPNEFDFVGADVSIQLLAGTDCDDELFLVWYLKLAKGKHHFVATDSDGMMVATHEIKG